MGKESKACQNGMLDMHINGENKITIANNVEEKYSLTLQPALNIIKMRNETYCELLFK